MIRTIKIELNAAYPSMPLEPVKVFAGSAATFTILNVPRAVGQRTVTGLSLIYRLRAGGQATTAAVRVGSAYEVTIPASVLAEPYSATLGIRFVGTGKDENGNSAQWVLGVADLAVLNSQGQVVPGSEGGDMNHSEFANIEALDNGTLKQVGAKVNEILAKLKGTVTAGMVSFVLSLPMLAATAADLSPETEIGDVSPTCTIHHVVSAAGIAPADYANVSNAAMLVYTKQDALPFATNAIPAAVVTDAPWITEHQSLAPATNYVDTVAAECVKTNGAQTIVGSLNIKNGNGLSMFEVEPIGAAIQIKAVSNLSPRLYLEGEYGAPSIVLKSGGGRGKIEFRDEDLIYSLNAHASGDIAVTDDLTNLVAKTEADSTSVFSTNILALADAATASKLATETMYKMSSGTAYEVGSNTVQYIDLSAADLPIVFTPPTSVSGRASDWVVYCFASADTANAVGFGGFGANHLWANDAAATNAAVKTGITMFMFSQIKSDTFVIGRQELKSVSE